MQDVAARSQMSLMCVIHARTGLQYVRVTLAEAKKPAEVRQGHFAKYMAPGHGVRKIYSSRVCAIKRAIKKRRVRGDIHVDSDKACLKRQVMHNVHKMWITSLLFGIHLHGSRRIWRINANALIISGKSA